MSNLVSIIGEYELNELSVSFLNFNSNDGLIELLIGTVNFLVV